MVVLSRLLAAVVLWLLVMMVMNLEMEMDTFFLSVLSFFIRFFFSNRHVFLMFRPRCCIFLCLWVFFCLFVSFLMFSNS